MIMSYGAMETWRRLVIALRSVWEGHTFQSGWEEIRDWFTKPRKKRE